MPNHRRLPRNWPTSKIPDTPAGLEDELYEKDTWAGVDALLRRLLLLGVAVALWVGISIGFLWCIDHVLTPPPPTDVYPSNAPTLLSCPTDGPCR